ncbi:hypothetical protein FNF27_04401 [Cafeteria roenbergensis]|uniref:Sideroflexin n=1 Tax=Cafeteria roenbergensis TaxID=33653 RepID=A0A5A8CCM3_CAFRO|nr:hypothetical protein FNF29_05927 [Cafeteria roenbergensis]KAA0174180.1 hypothetical protein FNF27_04401 [Cafeteria roenbergensis]|eukprot:KAA0149541.1 hypothetical protein FNF29_05927 [Cafeteria roenbergensis]
MVSGPAASGDEGPYWSRVKVFFKMVDPRNALLGQSDVDWARQVLSGRAEHPPSVVERAQDIVQCVVHPDTGLPVSPFFLRLSCIVPANMTLDCLMITASTPWQTAGAQALNQCYNAAHYWANRNHTNDEPPVRVAASFTAATASSVWAALRLQRAASAMQGAAAVVLRRSAPFLAVAAADVLNLGIMRSNEWARGIAVKRRDGTEVGRSRRAGAMAVASCVAARVMAAAPVLLSSSFALEAMERAGPFRPGAALASLRVPAALAVLGSAIVCAVPLTFALFRREATVSVSWLEPEFRSLDDGNGLPVSQVWYHKGL